MSQGKITYARDGHRIYEFDGKVVSKSEFDRLCPDKPLGKPLERGMLGGVSGYSESRPLVSEADGCHPEMAQQHREFVHRAGIKGVDFNDKGQALFTSRAARRDYHRAVGRHDSDAGYGD